MNPNSSLLLPVTFIGLVIGTSVSFHYLSNIQAALHSALLLVVIHIAWTDLRQMQIHLYSLAACFLIGLGFIVATSTTETAATTGAIQQIVYSIIRAGSFLLVFFCFDQAYKKWRGISGIGLGDILLFGAAGLWLPLRYYPDFVLIASAGALAFVVAQAMIHKKAISNVQRIPFGVFLAGSLWFAVLLAYS